MSEAALLDDFPELFDGICAMADRLARGESPSLPEHETVTHARQRWRHGYELHEVLCELTLLRSAIADVLGDGDGLRRCIAEAIDQAMLLSAKRFADATGFRPLFGLEEIFHSVQR